MSEPSFEKISFLLFLRVAFLVVIDVILALPGRLIAKTRLALPRIKSAVRAHSLVFFSLFVAVVFWLFLSWTIAYGVFRIAVSVENWHREGVWPEVARLHVPPGDDVLFVVARSGWNGGSVDGLAKILIKAAEEKKGELWIVLDDGVESRLERELLVFNSASERAGGAIAGLYISDRRRPTVAELHHDVRRFAPWSLFFPVESPPWVRETSMSFFSYLFVFLSFCLGFFASVKGLSLACDVFDKLSYEMKERRAELLSRCEANDFRTASSSVEKGRKTRRI